MSITLKAVIGFLILHGVTVLGYALWVGQATAGANEADVIKAVTRLAIILILAWGLVSRQGWAYWLALAGSGIGAVTGVVRYAELWRTLGDPSALGSLHLVVALLTVGSLFLACLLLLLPSGRGDP